MLANGALDLENLREAIDRERPLVAVQQVNSETGNRQDFAAIAAIVRDAGGMLLALTRTRPQGEINDLLAGRAR